MTRTLPDPGDATAARSIGECTRSASIPGLVLGAAASAGALGSILLRMLVVPDPQHIDPFRSSRDRRRRSSLSRAA